MMTVSDSMMGSALTRLPAVNTTIGALGVGGNTPERTVIKGETEICTKQPQYTHGFLWDAHDMSEHSDFGNMACWELTASPVPGVPLGNMRTSKHSEPLKQTLDCSR